MKSHQEESRTDRVNIGGKPGNDKVKGGIGPLEVEAFKRRVEEGNRLYYYKPRRRGDDEIILEKMSVVKSHGHIVTTACHEVKGNTYETSVTWGEAIQLNRMTQEQLARELARMRKEVGIAYSSDNCPEEVGAPDRRKINREEYVGRIMTFRNMGMTYTQISYLVGISTGTAREIYMEEAKQDVW